jgi:two-component system nitrate/nitrite response regulator NarL
MQSILVIEPQTLLRRGLVLLLRQWQADAEYREAATIDAALAAVQDRDPPALALLDAGLAGEHRFAGLERLVHHLPAVPIVLLAGDVDWGVAAATLAIGARGYLPKSASEAALHHAVALAISGEIYLPRAFFLSRAAGNMPAERSLPAGNLLRRLTPRQREVLSHLARGQSNKEIARRLGLFESTVKVHVKTILKKLDAANRTQAAMLAAGQAHGDQVHGASAGRSIDR